ncbi:uncharacterized protein TRAVEDRAFT_54284 [Trametes versicolor FP-101664 SS1]|uniref:Protein kinase domain-containing protein n=1 Tax=Trametes versicolor (strain FP-101664) TaxID=717944 RepID=R7S832_TRAVS|nr:uncharacterized protein TRAVEDRAFT_54284 [Trametes versicolor FP-101664 SS1]EIW51865.1 hypothetical protein TRAVEDRAFT_54284 [Trametes versicolor FP-101664 SS1]
MKRRRRTRALSFVRRHTDIADELQTGVDIEQRIGVLAKSNDRLLQHVEDSARVGDVLIRETKGIRIGVLDLAQRLNASTTFDGRFRLFAQENLELVEPIRDAESLPAVTRQAGEHTLSYVETHKHAGRVVRFRAIAKASGELSDTQVVVHAYSHRDQGRFMEAVKSAKQVCHPYILAMLGYSRPGRPDEASYIVMEDYCLFEEYISSFHGTRKLRAILKMTVEMCMAVDHLETLELRQLFPKEFWISTTQHPFGFGELVFDRRHGGRVKWARGPLSLGKAIDRDAYVPATQAERARLLNALWPVMSEDAGTGAVVHCWFSEMGTSFRAVNPLISGRSMRRRSWEVNADPNHPRVALGEWLGSARNDDTWSALSERNASLRVEAVTSFERVPLVVSRPDSPSEAPAEPSQHNRDHAEGEDHLSTKLWEAKELDIPESDCGEMCIDVVMGADGTRWKRYQFSCVPVDTTLLFRQSVNIANRGDAISRTAPSALGITDAVGYKSIGIAQQFVYFTETIAKMDTHAAAQAPLPLWFFMLQFDADNSLRGAARDCNAPWAFWSSEKHPTAVPAGIRFDPTPRSEHVEGNCTVPWSTWTQELGCFSFVIQSKMCTAVLNFGADELLALRELQGNRHCANHTERMNGSSNDGDDIPAHVFSELASSQSPDGTESECEGEEYYSADEDEDVRCGA